MERQQSNGHVDAMEIGQRDQVKVVSTRKIRVKCGDMVLRISALILTLVAAIVVGVDKQTKVVAITLTSTLPPLHVPLTAKWHYMSAFLYFVVANAIACSYAAFSLIGTLANPHGKIGMGLVILISDLLMVALLFSGNGAAAGVGLIGYKGNSHVQWNKVCNVFDNFCQHIAIGIAISLLGSLAFVALILLSIVKLYKRSK